VKWQVHDHLGMYRIWASYRFLLICDTGAAAKRLRLPNEDKYWSKGITACAICDGAAPIYKVTTVMMIIIMFIVIIIIIIIITPTPLSSSVPRRATMIPRASPQPFTHSQLLRNRTSPLPLTPQNQPLAVVGGGDSAAEEAVYLTKYSPEVHLLVRSDHVSHTVFETHRLWRSMMYRGDSDLQEVAHYSDAHRMMMMIMMVVMMMMMTFMVMTLWPSDTGVQGATVPRVAGQ
jgi:hypothetical protein